MVEVNYLELEYILSDMMQHELNCIRRCIIPGWPITIDAAIGTLIKGNDSLILSTRK